LTGKACLLAAAVLLLLLHGCGGWNRNIPSHAPPQEPPPPPPPTSVAPPPSAAFPPPVRPPAAPPPRFIPAADRAYASGQAAMAEKNYERAVELFAAAWKESPGYPGLEEDFPKALSSLKAEGDEAFRHGRMEESGRRWSAALRYLSHPAVKGNSFPFTKNDLRANIDKLSANLMEKGLIEYRKGNLEAAIAVWKSILSYEPAHAEAARSVKTASTQLENLKKITPQK
jgi:tetratricopeptide (TPR) repeat protein